MQARSNPHGRRGDLQPGRHNGWQAPGAGAIYIYLRPPQGFRSHRQEEPQNGVIIDFDAKGIPIGIELLGPGKLDIVLKKMIPKYGIPALKQVLAQSDQIEELLESSSH